MAVPELDNVALRAHWVESHVERMWLEFPERKAWDTPMPTRDDVRARIENRLRQSLTSVLHAALQDLQDARRDDWPNPETRDRVAREAIDSWNADWARLTDNGWEVGPSLAEVSLPGVSAPNINLRNADLSSHEPMLVKKFFGSDFERADFRGANLSRADLSGSNLGSATFVGAHLGGAVLADVNAQRADFFNAEMTGSSLVRSNLSGSRFIRTNLTRASMHKAVLDSAEFLGTVGLRVNENSVDRTRFLGRSGIFWSTVALLEKALTLLMRRLVSPHEIPRPLKEVNDIWSRLRGDYTGPNFVLTLLLVAMFVLPLVGRGIALRELSAIEATLLPGPVAGDSTRPPDDREMADLRRRLGERLTQADDAYSQASMALNDAVAEVSEAPACARASGQQAIALTRLSSQQLQLLRERWEAAGLSISQAARGEWTPDVLRGLQSAALILVPTTKRVLLQTQHATSAAVQLAEALPKDCVAPAATSLRESQSRAQAQLTRLESLIEGAVPEIQRLIEGKRASHTFPIWKVMLGLDEAHGVRGYVPPILLLTLLFYNLIRGLLTVTISAMRDAEDRSRVTPAKLEYEWLLPFARAVSWLKIVAVALALYGFVDWMRTPVLRFW